MSSKFFHSSLIITIHELDFLIISDHDCVVCGEPGIATLYCESCKKFSCDDCSLITHRHKLKRNHNPYTLKEYYKKNPFYIPGNYYNDIELSFI